MDNNIDNLFKRRYQSLLLYLGQLEYNIESAKHSLSEMADDKEKTITELRYIEATLDEGVLPSEIHSQAENTQPE